MDIFITILASCAVTIGVSFTAFAVVFIVSGIKDMLKDERGEKMEEHYDEHYKSEHQPIEVMQANMTNDEFIGFLRGNIIKYALRFGRKDDTKKEAAKIKRYAEWLVVAVNGETINPRE